MERSLEILDIMMMYGEVVRYSFYIYTFIINNILGYRGQVNSCM